MLQTCYLGSPLNEEIEPGHGKVMGKSGPGRGIHKCKGPGIFKDLKEVRDAAGDVYRGEWCEPRLVRTAGDRSSDWLSPVEVPPGDEALKTFAWLASSGQGHP